MTAGLAPVGRFTVPADHPCLPGHFPGHPIVPGVVVLDEAVALLLGRLPGAGLAGILAAKFVAAVPPGAAVEVHAAAPVQGRLAFTCTVASAVVVRGTIGLGDAAT